jgi:hypothetical protein
MSDEQIEELQRQLAAMETSRRESEAKQAKQARTTAVEAALMAASVPGRRVKHAIAFLRQEGLLGSDGDGRPTMKIDRAGYQIDVPVREGVAEWLKTDDGKFYRRPVAAERAGSSAPTVKGADGHDDVEKARDLASKKILGAARRM